MSRSAPPIHDIATFVAVAQHASFTRAAERLETSKSNVRKAVQRLEDRLGTKLFQRTTRAVRLTLMLQSQLVQDAAAEAEACAQEQARPQPAVATPEDIRNNLRDAVRLFNEAGYEVRDQKMVNKKTGEPFTVELLAEDPTFAHAAFVAIYSVGPSGT